MKYPKKSLGQNFLIDNNIIKKIINSVEIKNKNIVEIGPGKGALTKEILKKKPKSLILIEKDFQLFNELKHKYSDLKNIKVINNDILKFDIEGILKKKSLIFGNLPYNISSQILVKFIKFKNWPPHFTSLIFMFQKELGEKIICDSPSPNYGRISILRKFRLKFKNKFFVSPNCFFPKPKVNSMVIHFVPYQEKSYSFKRITNLEKITNIFFSKKRKIIKKSLEKLINKNNIRKLSNINLRSRPAEIKPEIYYKITELYEGQ